jgi:hypothetical protein
LRRTKRWAADPVLAGERPSDVDAHGAIALELTYVQVVRRVGVPPALADRRDGVVAV